MGLAAPVITWQVSGAGVPAPSLPLRERTFWEFSSRIRNLFRLLTFRNRRYRGSGSVRLMAGMTCSIDGVIRWRCAKHSRRGVDSRRGDNTIPRYGNDGSVHVCVSRLVWQFFCPGRAQPRHRHQARTQFFIRLIRFTAPSSPTSASNSSASAISSART